MKNYEEEGDFDVVLEKGVLDAVEQNEELYTKIAQNAFKEVSKKKGSTLVSVSLRNTVQSGILELFPKDTPCYSVPLTKKSSVSSSDESEEGKQGRTRNKVTASSVYLRWCNF